MKIKYLKGRHCNCVLYLRKLGYKFPYGMWTLWAKKRIINSQTPRAGAIAIMAVGKWGHVGVVKSVKGKIIKIQEANYKRCRITQRWGTKTELRIVGYYVNSKNLAKHKTPPKISYRYYRVRKGDTLWKIAKRCLGSGLKWTRLRVYRNGAYRRINPITLKVGEKVRIPK